MNNDWKNTQVALCATHHLRDGAPAYPRRFVRVLSFHAPGLAAVRDERAAWHIDTRGNAAYQRTFDETFGFYEYLAAVNDAQGWFHIHPDGTPVYVERYAWCGNFQGGRCVVCTDGRYHHITADGSAAYRQTYSYAGDFREGCAAVKGEDGLYFHILADGELAHAHCYRNLDAYHKGYARACDQNGWMHINRQGLPIYENRYAAVEPFYNGRAVVQTEDGKTFLIDECGNTIAALD